MSSPCNWFCLLLYLNFAQPHCSWVEAQCVTVISICTDSAKRNVDLSIVNIACLSPTLQHLIPRHQGFPFKIVFFSTLKQSFEIDSIGIAKQLIVTRAASKDIEVSIEQSCRVKPSLFWADSIVIKLNFLPLLGYDVEDPKIIEIQVRNTFSAMDNEIRIRKLAGMVCPFPWCRFRQFRQTVSPYFILPIEHADAIVPGLIVRPSSEEYNAIIDSIVVNGIIGPALRHMSSSRYRFPCVGDSGETPEISKVFPIGATASEASEEDDLVAACCDQAMPPTFRWTFLEGPAIGDCFPLHFLFFLCLKYIIPMLIKLI